jgi:hypothetical protein
MLEKKMVTHAILIFKYQFCILGLGIVWVADILAC